jgi:type IV pilus assembly protein PilV
MRTSRDRSPVVASGFTLVEVLVVTVVMAVGLIGSAALLLTGLRASRLAMQQTKAVNLAADLGDRIRANRSAGTAYALGPGAQLAAPARACQSIGECDPHDVAARDLYEWQQAARSALPGAMTSVRVSPASGPPANIYVILVEWTQPGQATNARFALVVQA